MHGRHADVIDDGDRGVTGQFHVGPGGAPLIKPESFWGLDGEPAPVNDDMLFLVALMENDNGKPEGIRPALHAELFAALTSYANSGMDRDMMVARLLKDIRDFLKGAITIGVLNNDDLIGVAELRIPPDYSGVSSLRLKGDGGEYALFFLVDRQASTIRPLDLGKIVSSKTMQHKMHWPVD